MLHPVSTPGAPPVFPSVRASNLNRRSFTLPTDFEGERNLVIIAFQRDQQSLSQSWTPTIARLLAGHPDLRFYELPTISHDSPARVWLDDAMRRGVPDLAAREQTITLYLDKAAFRRALGLPHEQTIYLLLLGRDGRVLWRGDGAYTERLGHELQQVLGEAR